MQNYYKQEAEYYQKRYEATQDNLNELHYQLGWLRGSLESLKKLVESGKVTTARINFSCLFRSRQTPFLSSL